MNKMLSGLLLAACCALPPAFAASPPDVLAQPAVQGPQALHAVLQDVTRAGNRLVAVGERGVVLLSDDNGTSWRQASAVPVSASLVAVQFVDARNGWAVGHAGVVLHSDDGGEHWSLQLDGRRAAALELRAAEASADAGRVAAAQRLVADGADKPLLALHFSDARHGLVLGAYGLALATTDGGRSWQSWMGHLPNPQGLHLYAVAGQGSDLYIAGEQGLLLRSRDAGDHWEALDKGLPDHFYVGVMRDAMCADDHETAGVYFGARNGSVWASADAGETWREILRDIPDVMVVRAAKV